MKGDHCGWPLAAVADLTAALWGSRGGLERSGEWMRTAVALQASKGQGPDAVTRGHARAKRALGTPNTRTLRARHNAKACKRARVRLGISRPGLGLARSLVDKLVRLEDQVYNAN